MLPAQDMAAPTQGMEDQCNNHQAQAMEGHRPPQQGTIDQAVLQDHQQDTVDQTVTEDQMDPDPHERSSHQWKSP